MPISATLEDVPSFITTVSTLQALRVGETDAAKVAVIKSLISELLAASEEALQNAIQTNDAGNDSTKETGVGS